MKTLMKFAELKNDNGINTAYNDDDAAVHDDFFSSYNTLILLPMRTF